MKRLQALAVAALAIMAAPASAIDSVRFQAQRVTVAGHVMRDAAATLLIQSGTRSSVSARATGIALPPSLVASIGPLLTLRLDCDNPVVREPVFECPALSVQASTSRWPQVRLRGAAGFRSDIGVLTARGTTMAIAGSLLKFDVTAGGDRMRGRLEMPSLALPAAREFAKPWFTLPADLEISGTADLSVMMERVAGADIATVDLAIREAGLQNAAYTWIGEKIEASVHARMDISGLARHGRVFEISSTGSRGQLLAGPVLLDFDRNPLELQAAGIWSGNKLHVTDFISTQKDLLAANGNVQIGFSPLYIHDAEVEASEIIFPSAYTSYLHVPLATTAFNQLVTEGKAHASLRMLDNKPVQATLVVEELGFHDDARKLRVTGVEGELYWTAGATGPARPSFLSWESAQGWGIVGAQSRIDFSTRDRDFQLLQAARLPFFDGALIINALAVERFGEPDMAGNFDAVIEPISVAQISRGLGWPEFQGTLSGRIPGLTYRNGELTLEGDLEADVFDGTVVASNLRVRDPLGKWPRLYADVIAFNLDLDLVTRTFEFGSITGRIDVDLKGLETFNWSPVAFDLRVATPKDDKSPHRISQRAVANLSNIGGGGGGVAAAFQSGALQFFETFRYDQIGLSCRLRNDVCQMSGVGTAPGGYYILRGAGLPHLDIIGKSTRVDWPRFVSQVTYGIRNSDSIQVN